MILKLKTSTQNFFSFTHLILPVSCLLILSSCGQKADKSSSSPPTSPQKIILKVAQNSNVNHPYQKGLEKFKEVLEKESGGQIEVQIFPNGQLGNEEQEAVGVKFGILDATIVSSGNLAPFVPEIDLFNLPFIFRDLDHFYRVLDGPVGQWMGRIIEKRLDCIFLGYCSFGIRNTWNSKKPVHTPDDLKGLKIRVMSSPILLSAFDTLGAQATTMSWNELYSALQQGVLDGAECSMSDLYLEKFYEVTKYVSLTQHLIGAAVMIFSQKRYETLPPPWQTAVLKAGHEAVLTARQAEEEMSNQAFQELKKRGLQFFEVDTQQFRAKAVSIYKKYAPKLGGMELINQIIDQ